LSGTSPPLPGSLCITNRRVRYKHYAKSSVPDTCNYLFSHLDPAHMRHHSPQPWIWGTNRQDHVGATHMVLCKQIRGVGTACFKRNLHGNGSRFSFGGRRLHRLADTSLGIRHPIAGEHPPYPQVYRQIVRQARREKAIVDAGFEKIYNSSGVKATTSSMEGRSRRSITSRSSPKAIPDASGMPGSSARNLSGIG
jgi:hypothetical protein